MADSSALLKKLLFSSTILLTVLSGLRAEGEERKQQFLSAYEPGVRPFVEFYENVRMRTKYIIRRQSGETTVLEKVYSANAGRFRLDTLGEKEGHRTTVALPGGHSFSARQYPGKDRFQLYHATTDYADKLDEMRQFSAVPFYAFCSCFNLPITELVRDPGFTITDLRHTEENGEKLARLDFELVDLAPHPDPTRRGSIFFAPYDCWAMRAMRVSKIGSKYTGVRRFQYEGRQKGVPLLKRLEKWAEDANGKRTGPDGKLIEDELIADVIELVPGPVSEEEFTLASIGLSDAGLQGSVPPWYYLQLFVVASLVAAGLFWHLAMRARLRSQTMNSPGPSVES